MDAILDLSISPAFSSLYESEVQTLSSIAFTQTYTPGERIFSQGEKSFGVYLVQEGSVQIQVEVGGRCVDLHRSGPGDMLGWSGLVEPHTFTCSAVALTPTDLIGFRLEDIRRLVDENEHFACSFLADVNAIVIGRLRETQARLAEVVSWYRYCRGYPM